MRTYALWDENRRLLIALFSLGGIFLGLGGVSRLVSFQLADRRLTDIVSGHLWAKARASASIMDAMLV